MKSSGKQRNKEKVPEFSEKKSWDGKMSLATGGVDNSQRLKSTRSPYVPKLPTKYRKVKLMPLDGKNETQT